MTRRDVSPGLVNKNGEENEGCKQKNEAQTGLEIQREQPGL